MCTYVEHINRGMIMQHECLNCKHVESHTVSVEQCPNCGFYSYYPSKQVFEDEEFDYDTAI